MIAVIRGTFQLDRIIHLRSTLESKDSHIKQNGIPMLIGMHSSQKASEFQNSNIKKLIRKCQ